MGDETEQQPTYSLPDGGAIPRHLAVIMDGNGRWAKQRWLPRFEGHRAGVKTVRSIVEECRRLGIKYLTLFSFSTENWGRPADEVSGLMGLFRSCLQSELRDLIANGVRLRAIGDRTRLPAAVREALEQAEEVSKHVDGMQLILALSYGGRDEIVRAVKQLSDQVVRGALRAEEITEATVSGALDTSDIPDPDLLIRTSDELRLSNFLLWQLAYAEIIVTPVLWPDFSRDELHRCLREYGARERRFGKTAEQIQQGAIDG